MGINSVLTPDDIKKTLPVTPGWYPFEIVNYDEQVTKGTDDKPSDGSLNAIYTFKALEGESNIKGREIKKYFNEKSMHWGKNLWATLFPGEFDRDKGGNLSSEMLRSAIGKKLMCYVKMNGSFPNIEDYRPIQ